MTHDNSLKPVLHLKLGKPPNFPPIGGKFAGAPREPPVSWSNYRSVLETLPELPFDWKTASAEQWQAYGATLTKRQKRAQCHRWAASICADFAHGFGAIGDDKKSSSV